MDFIQKWISKLEKVNIAQTQEEKDAIYHLRYRVYIEELNKEVSHIDHDKKVIIEPEDYIPNSVLFYTGTAQNPTGTFRITIWEPGTIPTSLSEQYSLDIFPDIDKHSIGETAKLIVDKKYRSKLIVPSLARALYEYGIEKHLFIIFAYCAPGLVNSYKTLGYRPYSSRMISTYDGVRIPLVMFTYDYDFFKEVESPLAYFYKTYFNKIEISESLEKYKEIVGSPKNSFELSVEKIWEQLQEEILKKEENTFSFFDNLSDEEIIKIVKYGFFIETEANEIVTREEMKEQEMFLIMGGSFEVFSKDKRITILYKGDIFGEIALLLDSGKRSASIRCLSKGKLLVLRRRFLLELIEKEPTISSKILFNLSRILADRFRNLLIT